MIRRNTQSNFTAVLLAACIAFVGMAVAVPNDADLAALREQTVNWVKAYNAADGKAVAAQYAEDALLLPPGAAAVKGRPAILAYFTKDVAASKAAGAVFALGSKTDAGSSGDMGWESGTYKVSVKGAVVETGKFLSVSRKKDGKWLYIRDTWNSDSPPAAAAAPAAKS